MKYFFIDFETINDPAVNIRKVGAKNYLRTATPSVLSIHTCQSDVGTLFFRTDNGKGVAGNRLFRNERRHAPDSVGKLRKNNEGETPLFIKKMARLVLKGEAKLVAFNYQFDKPLWDREVFRTKLTDWADAKSLSDKLGLGSSLDAMAKSLGIGGKKKPTPHMFKQATNYEDNPEKVASYELDMSEFLEYAVQDTYILYEAWHIALGRVYEDTPFKKEYAVFNAVNSRSLRVDRKTLEGLVTVKKSKVVSDTKALAKLTEGRVRTAKQTAMLLYELKSLLSPEHIDLLKADNKSGYSLGASNVAKLIKSLRNKNSNGGLTPEEHTAFKLLKLKQEAGGSAIAKAEKLLQVSVAKEDGELYYYPEYNSDGAMTGRFTCYGVQLQNLTRFALRSREEEEEVRRQISAPKPIPYYNKIRKETGLRLDDLSSALIRGSFMPHKGEVFVWADWASMEARVQAWMAQESSMLDAYQDIDDDPTLPDMYVREASKILGKPASEITKVERQNYGKLPILSLGYGAGEHALLGMAEGYGVDMSTEEATNIVQQWRNSNTWSTSLLRQYEAHFKAAYFEGVRSGANTASCGLVDFAYDPYLLSGTMITTLPCGRRIYYPGIRFSNGGLEFFTIKNNTRTLARLWGGQLLNHIVQGTSASFMRQALVACHKAGLKVALHTHDEIVLRVKDSPALIAEAEEKLAHIMIQQLILRAGLVKAEIKPLPLNVDSTSYKRYTKAGD